MKAETSSTPNSTDIKTLRSIILKLSIPTISIAIILAAIIGLLWLNIFKRILAFGHSLNIAKLDLFGKDVNNLLQQFNPYFWWVVCIIASLIALWIIIKIIVGLFNKARFKLVDDNSFQRLSSNLSVPAIQVILWVWSADDEPLRLGDLKQALGEITTGRFTKLQTAQRQKNILEQAQLQQSQTDS